MARIQKKDQKTDYWDLDKSYLCVEIAREVGWRLNSCSVW